MTPPLKPSSDLAPSDNLPPSGGDRPSYVVRLSFDPAGKAEPLSWVNVSDRLRSFSIDRGGENELELIDTGTAQVVLSDPDRALDPFNTSSPYAPNVKPRRRLWIQGQWAGQTHDLFYGWTGAFKPDWPGQGVDKIVELGGQDANVILAGDKLPTTSPPRDSLTDLIEFDQPFGHYPLNETVGTEVFGAPGENGVYKNTPTLGVPGLVVGERFTAVDFAATSGEMAQVPIDLTQFVDTNRLTLEAWVRAGDDSLAVSVMQGPGHTTHGVTFFLTGDVAPLRYVFGILNTAGTSFMADSTTAPSETVVQHVVGTYDGANLRIYVNGVLEDTTAVTGTLLQGNDDTFVYIGEKTGALGQVTRIQHATFYEHALSQARITAHFVAGRDRGRPQERADQRIVAMLEQSGLGSLPRRLRTGVRQIQPVFYAGQEPSGELDAACIAEGVPSVCFFAKDGAAVFLDRNHRAASPWSTVQATFDDDGTDVPYYKLDVDHGEAFIFNDVRVTARGGTLQQRENAASQSEYGRGKVLDRGETLNVSDTDAGAEADALLAALKDPKARITGIELRKPATWPHMLGRDIGDRVQVFRRPDDVGSPISPVCFIRKISLNYDADTDFLTCEWAVTER